MLADEITDMTEDEEQAIAKVGSEGGEVGDGDGHVSEADREIKMTDRENERVETLEQGRRQKRDDRHSQRL